MTVEAEGQGRALRVAPGGQAFLVACLRRSFALHSMRGDPDSAGERCGTVVSYDFGLGRTTRVRKSRLVATAQAMAWTPGWNCFNGLSSRVLRRDARAIRRLQGRRQSSFTDRRGDWRCGRVVEYRPRCEARRSVGSRFEPPEGRQTVDRSGDGRCGHGHRERRIRQHRQVVRQRVLGPAGDGSPPGRGQDGRAGGCTRGDTEISLCRTGMSTARRGGSAADTRPDRMVGSFLRPVEIVLTFDPSRLVPGTRLDTVQMR